MFILRYLKCYGRKSSMNWIFCLAFQAWHNIEKKGESILGIFKQVKYIFLERFIKIHHVSIILLLIVTKLVNLGLSAFFLVGKAFRNLLI